MATHHGNAGTIHIGADAVLEIKSWSLDQGIVLDDDSAMGDAWETHLAGIKNWSGSLDCHWDPDDDTGQEAMTVGATVVLNMYPEADGSGADYYSGAASIEGVGVVTDKAGIVSRSFTFKGNGALTPSTVA